jgi:hypothetical protein
MLKLKAHSGFHDLFLKYIRLNFCHLHLPNGMIKHMQKCGHTYNATTNATSGGTANPSGALAFNPGL